MDALLHATRKIMIERATNPQQQQQSPDSSSTIPDVAPPAYSASAPTPSSFSSTYSDDDDDDENDDDDDPSPMTITLDANTTVNGHGNMVATPALADATRFSALLLAAVQSLNAKAEAEAQIAASSSSSSSAAVAVTGARRSVRPTLSVQLVLNCGITVTGDRNVVGCRPAAAAATAAATTTASSQSGVLGKRKAEEDSGDAPPCKRIETSE